MQKVIIKQLRGKTWQEIPIETFRGRKPGELLRSFDGTDTVVECQTKLGVCYFAGKEKYRKLMQDKGNMAILCDDAGKLYPDHKQLMTDIIDVFGARPIETRDEPEHIQERLL